MTTRSAFKLGAVKSSYKCNTCRAIFAVSFNTMTDYTTKDVCCPVCWGNSLTEAKQDVTEVWTAGRKYKKCTY